MLPNNAQKLYMLNPVLSTYEESTETEQPETGETLEDVDEKENVKE